MFLYLLQCSYHKRYANAYLRQNRKHSERPNIQNLFTKTFFAALLYFSALHVHICATFHYIESLLISALQIFFTALIFYMVKLISLLMPAASSMHSTRNLEPPGPKIKCNNFSNTHGFPAEVDVNAY